MEICKDFCLFALLYSYQNTIMIIPHKCLITLLFLTLKSICVLIIISLTKRSSVSGETPIKYTDNILKYKIQFQNHSVIKE